METRSNTSTGKSCFVPYCKNTSLTTPNKIFINVPTDYKQRKLWFQAVKRKQKPNILKKTQYCCEDHFNMPNDMQNWMKYQLMPNTPVIMKKNIVPHIFKRKQNKTIAPGAGPPTTKKPKLQINNILVDTTKLKQETTTTTTFASFFKTTDIKYIKSTTLETTLNLIKKQSLFYIGIPDTAYSIINILSEKCNIEEKNILLCLEKIKRDIGMIALSNDFDTTKHTANQYFVALVPVIAQQLKHLIYWPPKHEILENIPRFYRIYSKAQSIISCFEINIPEPNRKVKKSIYWSERRNAYTYKYLISWTPDGIINYVSTHYGGKMSDSLILECSGFLDVVPEGCHILGDGFDVHNLLQLEKRGCTLHNVENDSLAALQSQKDNIFNQFKMFQFLKPYNHIELGYLYILDNVMLIVAGLINLRNKNK